MDAGIAQGTGAPRGGPIGSVVRRPSMTSL